MLKGHPAILCPAAPLAAYISPQVQTVDVDRTAFLNCTTEGHPQMSVSWLKDGKPLAAGSNIKFLPNQVSHCESLSESLLASAHSPHSRRETISHESSLAGGVC